MKGVWRIITILGIPVQVHWSFVFLFFWVYYEGHRNDMEWAGILMFGALVLALFFCVVLHEFGHALSARYYGVATRDITLSPIGGMARLSRMPEKPVQEFVVALAGPMVNLLIACLLWLWLSFFAPHFYPIISGGYADMFVRPSNFIPILFFLNLILFAFNLLPAFPMDGGRMLRALLSIRFGRLKATRVASIVGQIAACIFLVYAIYMSDIIMGMISVAVFFMARHEYRIVRMESILDNEQIEQLVRSHFTSLKDEDSMQMAFDEFIKGIEKNYLVYNAEQQQCGILTEKKILSAMQQKDTTASVAQYMSEGVVQLSNSDSLRTAYMKMQKPDYHIAAILEDGEVVGVLDRGVLDNYLNIQQKL